MGSRLRQFHLAVPSIFVYMFFGYFIRCINVSNLQSSILSILNDALYLRLFCQILKSYTNFLLGSICLIVKKIFFNFQTLHVLCK